MPFLGDETMNLGLKIKPTTIALDDRPALSLFSVSCSASNKIHIQHKYKIK